MKNKTNVLKLLSTIFFGIGLGLIVLGGLFFLIFVKITFEFAVIFSAVWAGMGVIFSLIALVMHLIYKNGADKKQKLKKAGQYVMADIVDIDENVNMSVQMGTKKMHPYFLYCQYVDGNGQPHLFKSGNLYYNPSGLLKSPQIKVYVDMANPKKYHVDTDSILPENAMLYKWEFSLKGNPKLMESGNYVQAMTCGIEYQGRFRLNGVCASQFLKLPDALAEKLNTGLDDKDRSYLGYTILCRYDAPDGTPHIFASPMLFGEAKSDYIDMPIKVYIDGNNYKRYHMDLRDLGIYE